MSCVVDVIFCVFKVGDKHSILIRKGTDNLYNVKLYTNNQLVDVNSTYGLLKALLLCDFRKI